MKSGDSWANPIISYVKKRRNTFNKSIKKCPICGEAKKGIEFSVSRGSICNSCRKERDGKKRYQRGSSPFYENEKCSLYLGTYIAEGALASVFKNVTRLPLGNPGYDFICGKGLKIDVKCACQSLGRRSYRWVFNINKNKVADYFLCLAFDSRDSLTPQHLWLIPGSIINDSVTFQIGECNEERWLEYERPIGGVIEYCNYLRREKRNNDGGGEIHG